MNKVTVPTGTSGEWSVVKFTITPEAAKLERLRGMLHGGRYVPEGDYTALKRGGNTIMSDTPDEMSDHRRAIHLARGRVLIAGLGLGMVLQAIASKPEVTHVTVIEQSEDVIALVWPHYLAMFGDKVELVHGSIFDYKPPKGESFDAAWYDIWDDLCTDNLKQMATLHRKFARSTGWQDSWGKEILKYRRERERQRGW